jgi:small conductance mechanosensitive channel
MGPRVVAPLGSDRALRLRQEAAAAARRARRQVVFIGPLFAGVIIASNHRHKWFPGLESEVQVAAAVALVALGWALARDLGRAFGPQLLGRLDPATAGTVGFLIRLFTVFVALLVALHIAGLQPRELAVGGAFTAVVVGLAAQQTLGNLFAGMVLLSARPFRVGERVRFQGGGIAGQVEGTVVSLGLLYVVLSHGADRIMLPNSVVLGCAVTPLREPDALDFVARLRAGVRPSEVQTLLDENVQTPTRGRPHINLQSMDDDEVVVRITAVPVDPEDGWKLADEVLAAVEQVSRDEITMEHVVGARAEAPET